MTQPGGPAEPGAAAPAGARPSGTRPTGGRPPASAGQGQPPRHPQSDGGGQDPPPRGHRRSHERHRRHGSHLSHRRPSHRSHRGCGRLGDAHGRSWLGYRAPTALTAPHARLHQLVNWRMATPDGSVGAASPGRLLTGGSHGRRCRPYRPRRRGVWTSRAQRPSPINRNRQFDAMHYCAQRRGPAPRRTGAPRQGARRPARPPGITRSAGRRPPRC